MTVLLWHGLAADAYVTIPLLWLLKPYDYAMVWVFMTLGLWALWLCHGMAGYDCRAVWLHC